MYIYYSREFRAPRHIQHRIANPLDCFERCRRPREWDQKVLIVQHFLLTNMWFFSQCSASNHVQFLQSFQLLYEEERVPDLIRDCSPMFLNRAGGYRPPNLLLCWVTRLADSSHAAAGWGSRSSTIIAICVMAAAWLSASLCLFLSRKKRIAVYEQQCGNRETNWSLPRYATSNSTVK